MIGEVYKNRNLYYEMMSNFLHRKISAWAFREQYMRQRDDDLDENKKSGYSDNYSQTIDNLVGNEKIFNDKYSDVLYEEGAIKLEAYEQGAQDLDIKGEWFFMGLWNFIDIYVIEYYPSDDEGFDPRTDVDEKTLTKVIQSVFSILERNKDRWEWDKTESIKR